MGSDPRIRSCVAVCAALLVSGVPASGQKALVANLLYEGPTLVAPAALLVSSEPHGRAWRVGLTGWTVSGEWSRGVSPARTVLLSGGLTPRNAHGSDRFYRNGERIPDLAYHNATAWIAGGVRLQPSRRWISEIRLIGQYERVDGLAEAALERWRRPFVGLDLAQTYESIQAEDPLRSHLEGVRVQGRVQAFAGTTAWGQALASADAGHALGPLLLRGYASYLMGHRLDTVSRFLVGGSWDSPGVHTLYGHPYAAFRLDRGALVRGGVDLPLGGDWLLGLRAAHLHSPGATHSGGMLRLGTSVSGVGAYGGIAFPDVALTEGQWDRALLVVGLSAAVLPE